MIRVARIIVGNRAATFAERKMRMSGRWSCPAASGTRIRHARAGIGSNGLRHTPNHSRIGKIRRDP